MKSFIHRSEFKSEKLAQFKRKVERINKYGKQIKELTPEEKKIHDDKMNNQRLKHE